MEDRIEEGKKEEEGKRGTLWPINVTHTTGQ